MLWKVFVEGVCAQSGNFGKCPFCKTEIGSKTDEEGVEELMKRVDVSDAGAMYILGSYYTHGQLGLQQDLERTIALWKHSAELGYSQAHNQLGVIYEGAGDLKKAKFHYEAGAMAGHEGARCNIGAIEFESGKQERAVKHFNIAASAGSFSAMYNLQRSFEFGFVSRESIDSTLTAYNNSCAEMRSEARDSYIRYKEKEG
jgi:TPR repeat protein